MITFYPRDIGMWRKEFNFNPPITLIPNQKTNYRTFRNQSEFFSFLKEHGVKFDDQKFPLKIEDSPEASKIRNVQGLQAIIQWTLLGWIKNDFR
jgi:hypothetical protein